MKDEPMSAERSSAPSHWYPEAPRILVATCMKDEGPFILEWIAWHRAIGVTDFIVFTNDCADGSDALLERLDRMGVIQHAPNPALGTGSTYFQPAALNYVPHFQAFKTCDFFISMDVDEFINVRVGDGRITDLLDAAGPFDALSMCELNHGANGNETYEPGWVTEQFPLHQTEAPGRWKAQRGVKTIVRPGPWLKKVRNHRPDANDGVATRWLDGGGRPTNALLEDDTLNGLDSRGAYALVSLDHFALRSLESYLAKMNRGDVVVAGKQVSSRYWRLRNQNGPVSSRFDRQSPNAWAEYDRLLEDTELKKLHESCCTAHRARIDELLSDPPYQERRQWILDNAWD